MILCHQVLDAKTILICLVSWRVHCNLGCCFQMSPVRQSHPSAVFPHITRLLTANKKRVLRYLKYYINIVASGSSIYPSVTRDAAGFYTYFKNS